MRLITITEVVLLMTFYGLSGAMTAEPSTFMAEEIWTTWKHHQEYDKEFDNVSLNTLEMIRRAGYPAEAHVVTTEDGYLLTLHRIPGSNNSLPILLQHGLLCSSADWVFLGKGKALAYLLADQGYDVWLGNYRGNTYSRAHIHLSPSNLTFWDFSFHEMGIYDLPAMIKFITTMRMQPLHTYIGHSMGTTGFYIMASESSEIAEKVRMMISLAPAVFISHMKSPIKYLYPFWREYKNIMQSFFHDELLPQNNLLKFLTTYVCNQNVIEEKICADLLFMVCGFDREQFNYTLIPFILGHDPAGTSSRTLLHFVQEYHSGKFRQYDYGWMKNLLKYKSLDPPDYKLASIKLPIALFYGPGDWLVNVKDVKKLYSILPNVIDAYAVPWYKFNHGDFIWATNAPELVYNRILKLMKPEDLNNVTLIG
ncbi:lipase 3-like isoform X2 [Nylanderia fulva]|nr:lipase 3-like isoform X2 [Nylanderia fulva]XP_029169362.1 lipase 3-like isoform X2 [Nylanderia fulva]XP_029169363.1 lipase 3-like isoform X2 [Nylanderia fulva]